MGDALPELLNAVTCVVAAPPPPQTLNTVVATQVDMGSDPPTDTTAQRACTPRKVAATQDAIA